MPFSVVILTLNEERNLPGCLQSVAFCDDIVVLDSGSTDGTDAIAREAGARVFVRKFDNFGGQRNFAQKHIPFRHPWVFHLDADEELTPQLAAECERHSREMDLDGYYVAPQMMFFGRWVPHCTDYPAWQARFVRAPQFEFIEVGHGQREAPHMRLGRLTESYRHDLTTGGVGEWLDKHRRYAKAEAASHLATIEKLGLTTLFGSNKLLRRRALKQLSYRLPFRPFFRFVYQYILRRGFLDGRPGFQYCLLLARYEGFTSLEIKRLKRAQTS